MLFIKKLFQPGVPVTIDSCHYGEIEKCSPRLSQVCDLSVKGRGIEGKIGCILQVFAVVLIYLFK